MCATCGVETSLSPRSGARFPNTLFPWLAPWAMILRPSGWRECRNSRLRLRRSSAGRHGKSRSPFLRAHVPRVPREQPMVAFQILHPILELAVVGLVKVLHDLRTRAPAPREMPLHILHEHGQGPNGPPAFGRTAAIPRRAPRSMMQAALPRRIWTPQGPLPRRHNGNARRIRTPPSTIPSAAGNFPINQVRQDDVGWYADRFASMNR